MSSVRRNGSSRVLDTGRNVKVRVVWSTPMEKSANPSVRFPSSEARELMAAINHATPKNESQALCTRGKMDNGSSRYDALASSKAMTNGSTSSRKKTYTASPTDESRTFPEIVHAMVTETAKEDPSVIDWVNDGEAFMIKQPESRKLSSLLHRHFRHGKYSSLQRQLNMYGWSKCVTGKYKGAFYNKHFHRDCQNTAVLATLIQRGDNLRKTPKSRRKSSQNTSATKKKTPASRLRTPKESNHQPASVHVAKRVTPFPNETSCPRVSSAVPIFLTTNSCTVPMYRYSNFAFHKGKAGPKLPSSAPSRAVHSPSLQNLPAKKRPVLLDADPFEGIEAPGLDQATPTRCTHSSSTSESTPCTFRVGQKQLVQWSPFLIENVSTPAATLVTGATPLSLARKGPEPCQREHDSVSLRSPKASCDDFVGMATATGEETFGRHDAADALALMAASPLCPPPGKPFLFSPTLNRFPPTTDFYQDQEQMDPTPPPTCLARGGSSSYAPLPLLRSGSPSQYLMPYAGMVADALGTEHELKSMDTRSPSIEATEHAALY